MPDETLTILTKIMPYDKVNNPIFGISMFDRLRVTITGWNTEQYKYQLPQLEKNKLICVKFQIKWPQLKSDIYALEPAIADGSQENHEMMDWVQAPITIQSGVTDWTFGFIKFKDVVIFHTFEGMKENQHSDKLLLK